MKSKSFSIHLLSLCLLLFIGTLSGYSQETRKFRHWSVGASFFLTTGHNDSRIGLGDYANYKGVAIQGSYKIRLYRLLYLRPDLSFHYALHGKDWGWIPSPEGLGNIREWGMGIGIPVGIKVPVKNVSFDLETGPTSTIYLNQKYIYDRYGIYVDSDGNPAPKFMEVDQTKRFVLRWMLGVTFNFWKDRLYAKLNYDFPLTKIRDDNYEVVKGQNVFTVGLGCNF